MNTKKTYGYDKNTDYQALMDAAVKSGNYTQAAMYEAQRNEKIAGEGLNYQPTNQYASLLSGNATGWENPYQAELDAAIAKLGDDGAYKKAFLQQADRTMQDTIGQYGTMTGGIPSTQAVAAASQAADYQKSQLASLLTERETQKANLLLSAGSQAQSDYQLRINEALNRWSQLGYADARVAQVLGVDVGTPTSDQSYLTWQQGQQDKADAYTLAMTLLQAGQMPNADTLAAAGIRAEDAQALLTSATQPTYSGGYGGGSGGGSGGGKFLDTETVQYLQNLFRSGDEAGAWTMLEYYGAQGYDTASAWNVIAGTSGALNGDFEGGYQGITKNPKPPAGGGSGRAVRELQ